MIKLARRIVHNGVFQAVIMAVIVANAVLVGL
jgi:hypothetical protein